MVRVFKSNLTSEECESLLTQGSDSLARETVFGMYEEYDINVYPDLQRRIDATVTTYLRDLGINNSYRHDCNRRIDVTGHIRLHYDNEVRFPARPGGKHYIRHFIVVTYLTDFELGKIHFPQHGLHIKPDRGDTIIFPASPFYMHEVGVPVGIRSIMRTEYLLNIGSLPHRVDIDIWD